MHNITGGRNKSRIQTNTPYIYNGTFWCTNTNLKGKSLLYVHKAFAQIAHFNSRWQMTIGIKNSFLHSRIRVLHHSAEPVMLNRPCLGNHKVEMALHGLLMISESSQVINLMCLSVTHQSFNVESHRLDNPACIMEMHLCIRSQKSMWRTQTLKHSWSANVRWTITVQGLVIE